VRTSCLRRVAARPFVWRNTGPPTTVKNPARCPLRRTRSHPCRSQAPRHVRGHLRPKCVYALCAAQASNPYGGHRPLPLYGNCSPCACRPLPPAVMAGKMSTKEDAPEVWMSRSQMHLGSTPCTLRWRACVCVWSGWGCWAARGLLLDGGVNPKGMIGILDRGGRSESHELLIYYASISPAL